MESNQFLEIQEPSIDNDKLSYEIFSILESKFLFGYDDQKLWIPKQISPAATEPKPELLVPPPAAAETDGVSAIKNQRGKICILSIDGGGMRGILSGKALAYLEHALKTKSGNPDARIADYFDVAAGTGIGGIFTAMLFGSKDGNSPIMKADETWPFLADNGKKFYRVGNSSDGNGNGRGGGGSGSSGGVLKRLFKSGSSTTASTAGLEKAMKETFMENSRSLTLKDTLKPVLIPCYDLSSTASFLFSRADALETDSFDFRLWEVCRATSAEPGLFDPIQMQSVDGQTKCLAVGGVLTMNNPTGAAITHVLHNKEEFPFVRGVEDLLVLSLGSGQVLEVSSDYEVVKNWKAKHWTRPMARIFGDGSAESVDQAIALAFGQYRSHNYVRIQANGSSSFGRCGANVDIDSSSNNVKMLISIAEEMLKQKNVESVLFGGKRIGEESNYQKLDWFADELLLEHQRRSCRIAPTVALKKSPSKLK